MPYTRRPKTISRQLAKASGKRVITIHSCMRGFNSYLLIFECTRRLCFVDGIAAWALSSKVNAQMVLRFSSSNCDPRCIPSQVSLSLSRAELKACVFVRSDI